MFTLPTGKENSVVLLHLPISFLAATSPYIITSLYSSGNVGMVKGVVQLVIPIGLLQSTNIEVVVGLLYSSL